MSRALSELLDDDAVEALVGPVEHRAGRALADAAGVRLRDVDADRVTAHVDLEPTTEARDLEVSRPKEAAEAAGKGTAHVELTVTGRRVAWSCDCPTGRREMPCEHVAATAIEARRRAGDNRSLA